jgi:hypothetical protein
MRLLVRVLVGALRANTEDVPVGMANLHLPDAPRLVVGRLDDLEPFPLEDRVDRVDVIDPQRQPRAVLATTTLSVEAEEDLRVPRT